MLKTTLLCAVLATPCYADSNTAIAVVIQAPPDPFIEYMDRLSYGSAQPHIIEGIRPPRTAHPYFGPPKCIAGCDANGN